MTSTPLPSSSALDPSYTGSLPNPFLLAADNSPRLLPLLRASPALAAAQDAHGYSLLHAAASYDHLGLLRALVRDFAVDVNLRDADGDTALFVAETRACARLLVEELRIDTALRGEGGCTARERLQLEGEFPDVVEYLLEREQRQQSGSGSSPACNGVDSAASAAAASTATAAARVGVETRPDSDGTVVAGDDARETEPVVPPPSGAQHPPLVPEGISISVGTMAPDEVGDDVVDPEFRRRIEELASREDFQHEEGQRELRDLITAAVRGQIGDGREGSRRRTS